MSTYSELTKSLKLTPKDGEATQAFLARLLKKQETLEDDAWKALPKKVQVWINAAVDAAEADKELPVPKGMDVKADEPKGKAAKATKANGKDKGKAAKANGKAKKVGAKREAPFKSDAKITVKEKAPHRDGTLIAQRYAKLKTGMTVEKAIAAGLSYLDLSCDVKRGNISIK